MTLDAMRLCGWCRAVPLLDARARFCGRRCRQSAWRLRERAALDPSPTSAPQRFAYADPPYPTLAARYYADEPTYAGEVDHGALLARLTTGDYDGWALSTSARALRLVLPLCPGRVRIGAGVQRDALVFSLGAFGVEVSPGAPPDAPVPSAPAVETLTTWAAVWMGRRTSTGAVRWPRDDRYRWEKHIAGSPLAALPLVDIRPRDVRAWLDGMMGKRKAGGAPLSRQTITHAFNLVRKALADAAADERIPSNPAAGLTVPKRAKKRDTDPWTHLTAEEVRAVEACEAMPEHLRLLFVVAIYTGLRAGELWARRWADVVTDGTACVTVRASHKNAPKNGKVQRVPLLPAARVAFEQLRALVGDTAPEELVFPATEGGSATATTTRGGARGSAAGCSRPGCASSPASPAGCASMTSATPSPHTW